MKNAFHLRGASYRPLKSGGEPMHFEESQPYNYMAALNGIRGTAVLMVVAAHFGLGLTLGGSGVDIFFVLSGFLITHGSLEELEKRTDRIQKFLRS